MLRSNTRARMRTLRWGVPFVGPRSLRIQRGEQAVNLPRPAARVPVGALARRRPHVVPVRALLLVVLSIAATMGTTAAAASAAPAWRIDSIADTTVAPGGSLDYLLQITDIGSSDATAPADPTCDPNNLPMDPDCLVFTADVPANMTATGISSAGNFTCAGLNVPGPTTVTCASADVITAPTDNTAAASSFRTPTLTVSVDPSASGTLTSSFEVSGGGASDPASTSDPTTVNALLPSFGIDAFDAQVASDAQGDPFTQAGGHPYSASTYIDFNTLTNPNPVIGAIWPVEPARDVLVDLPPGFIGNPTAAAKCSTPELANGDGLGALPLCAPTSQVGTTLVRLNGATAGVQNVIGPLPVFNMIPPPDAPARFGFNIDGTLVMLDARLRSDGDYGVTVDASKLPEALPIAGTSLTLWGVPSDPSHTSQRACAGHTAPAQGGGSCLSGAPLNAFLRLPTSCTAPGVGLPIGLQVDSWVNPGVFKDGSVLSHLPPAYPAAPADRGPDQGTTGCESVPFDPTFTGVAASPTRAGGPSGFTVDIDVPQNDDPDAIGEGDIKTVISSLPEGMRVSPSAADGLGACSEAQIALHSTADASCPNSAKVGSLTITTPLLDTPLSGSIYLATPHANPFDSLIAIYLVAKGSGVTIKLAGEVRADPHTGQLTATFDNQPQTPFTKLHLAFDGGPRASLAAPQKCGTYTTHTQLISWSGGPPVESDSSFDVSADGNGAPCPPPRFAPVLTAGTQNPVAGKESSFVLSLTRTDQDQNFASLAVNMPTGLLGKIKNTTLCSDAAAKAGSCGDASKIGSVSVGAGAGPNPFYITNGRAYITGPYKGGPYGLSIVVPAVAGPFDLGNVVVRAAIRVNRNSAALTIDSDPLPTILQGIPLDVRDVRVLIDRRHFIVNPTSCAEKHVLATVGSTEGKTAHVGNRFEVTDCAALALAPKITMTVGAKHHTRNGVSTPFSTTLTQKPGQSNLRSVKVTLPTTLNALLPVVNRACSLAAFQAGHCTSKTKVGTAVAVTPLLKSPLRGSAYFVKNPKRILPDLMVALRGQVSLDLTGKVSIPGGRRLSTTFDTIPDAPITRFTLKLVSGTNGPVGVVSNLCTAKARRAAATVSIRGQNGRLTTTSPRLHINGCGK